MTTYLESWRERYASRGDRVNVWRERHRICEDSPQPIDSLDEARTVLSEHAGHGPGCQQYLAALSRTSTVHA